MGNIVNPELEIKLNSEHYEFVQVEENEADKVVLQQFADERDLVYICLNGTQVFLPLKDLKIAVDSMAKNQDMAFKHDLESLEIELAKQKIISEIKSREE